MLVHRLAPASSTSSSSTSTSSYDVKAALFKRKITNDKSAVARGKEAVDQDEVPLKRRRKTSTPTPGSR